MALCDAVARGSPPLWPRVLLFGDSITQVPLPSPALAAEPGSALAWPVSWALSRGAGLSGSACAPRLPPVGTSRRGHLPAAAAPAELPRRPSAPEAGLGGCRAPAATRPSAAPRPPPGRGEAPVAGAVSAPLGLRRGRAPPRLVLARFCGCGERGQGRAACAHAPGVAEPEGAALCRREECLCPARGFPEAHLDPPRRRPSRSPRCCTPRSLQRALGTSSPLCFLRWNWVILNKMPPQVK